MDGSLGEDLASALKWAGFALFFIGVAVGIGVAIFVWWLM